MAKRPRIPLPMGMAAYLPMLMLIVGAMAALMVAAVVIIWLAPAYGWLALLVLIGVFVYQYGKAVAYVAPAKRQLDQLAFEQDGKTRAAVVELARYFAAYSYGGGVNVAILRMSIHDLPSGRRRRRCVLGDDADYLGRTGHGFWFYVHDRYHFGKAGLVCLSGHDGSVLYHLSTAEYQLDEQTRARRYNVRLIDRDEQPLVVDLKQEFAKLTEQHS